MSAAPLELLTIDAVPTQGVREFRPRPPWLFLTLLGLAALGCLWAGWFASGAVDKRVPALIAWWSAFWLGLIWLWLVVIYRRTLSPDAWLLRADERGIYVKWRSFQNLHWGRGGRQVVFLPFRSLIAARAHRRRWLTPTEVNETRSEREDYLELELSRTVDTTALGLELAQDRAGTIDGRRAASGIYRHHPVSLEDGRWLRIEWRALPGLANAIELLRAAGVRIEDAKASTLDLRDQPTDAALAELARRGDSLGLIRVLRRRDNIDLVSAKARAEELIRRANSADSRKGRSDQ